MTQEQIIKILKEDDIYKTKYENDADENKEKMDKLIRQLATYHTNHPNSQQKKIAEELKKYL